MLLTCTPVGSAGQGGNIALPYDFNSRCKILNVQSATPLAIEADGKELLRHLRAARQVPHGKEVSMQRALA